MSTVTYNSSYSTHFRQTVYNLNNILSWQLQILFWENQFDRDSTHIRSTNTNGYALKVKAFGKLLRRDTGL
jgi:hypothetical protein